MSTPEARWRIDDLAHRAGLTVDTIRFYQREGLLPPAQREGRTKVYGLLHLERLERIRELQERRVCPPALPPPPAAGRPRMIRRRLRAGRPARRLRPVLRPPGEERAAR